MKCTKLIVIILYIGTVNICAMDAVQAMKKLEIESMQEYTERARLLEQRIAFLEQENATLKQFVACFKKFQPMLEKLQEEQHWSKKKREKRSQSKSCEELPLLKEKNVKRKKKGKKSRAANQELVELFDQAPDSLLYTPDKDLIEY